MAEVEEKTEEDEAPAPAYARGPMSKPGDPVPADPSAAVGAIGSREWLIGEWTREREKGEELEKERRETMRGELGQVREMLGERTPEPPQLSKVPPPPDVKTGFQQNMFDWGQSAMLLALLGGAMSKHFVANAAESFTGAINGFHQGQVEQAKMAMDEWSKNSEAIRDNNKTQLDRYDRILRAKDKDIEHKLAEVRLVATEFQNEAVAQAADAKNVTELARMLELQRYHTEMLGLRHDAIDLSREKMNGLLRFREMGVIGTGEGSQWLIDAFARDWAHGNMENIRRLTPADRTRVMARGMEIMHEEGVDPAIIGQRQAEFMAARSGMAQRERTLSAMETKVVYAATESLDTIPKALAAMEKLGPSGYRSLNEFENMVRGKTASPDMREAAVWTRAVVTSYASALGRGNPTTTVYAQHEAERLINESFSLPDYRATVKAMREEMEIVVKAPVKVREILKKHNIDVPDAPEMDKEPPKTRLKWNRETGEVE